MRRLVATNRRRLTVVTAVVVVLNVLVVARAPGAPSGVPDWVTKLEKPQVEAVTAADWRESTSARLATSRGIAAAQVTLPTASKWRVRLSGSGTAAVPVDPPPRIPVAVTSRIDWAAGGTLQLEVLDRPVAQRLGATGFVFTISEGTHTRETAGRSAPGLFSRAADNGGLPTTLEVDYAGFTNAFGAGYADRLRVIGLRACALADPVPAGCDTTRTPLTTTNDGKAKKLVVDIPDLAALATTGDADAQASTVDPSASVAAFAVISAVGGDTGTFAATPLSITGSWQVTPGSGEFTYSYPMAVPQPGVGTAPTVSLNYSSGAIDGLTVASNTQGAPSGLGWSDFANAFIERSYEPCFRIGLGDLCWKSDNAVISLAGLSGTLIPISTDHSEWRVQNDPGWRVQRLQNAPYTSIYQGQHWLVTGPDGTKYYFGYGHMPGQTTNSILGVQVLADNTGEPCRGAGDTLSGCEQGWRWYLDRIEDPDGNITSLVYSKEKNWYSPINGYGGPETNNRGTSPYDRAALLSAIYYGGRDWTNDKYSGRITFGLEHRCVSLDATCPAADPSIGMAFPDVPSDLLCAYMAPCTVYSPAFFSGRRYSYVRTEVKVGTQWKNVAQYNLIHTFGSGQNGVAYKLHLAQVQHAAIALGRLNAYPTTNFGYRFFDNRADHDSYIPKAMRHNRLETITNPFGGTTRVTYFLNRFCEPTYNPTPRWDLNVRDCFPQSVIDGSFTRTGIFHKYLVQRVVESPGGGSPDMTTSYSYGGDPAWAFDTSAFARDEDESGWSRWRGYGTATITKGTSKTEIQVFRGWHDDPTLVLDAGGNWVPLGKRNVQVTALDGSGTQPDLPELAGRTLVERQLGSLNGVANSVLQSRRHGYETRLIFDPGPNYLFDVTSVNPTVTTERVYSTPTVFRERRSQTTYQVVRDANNLIVAIQPESTLEEGWLDVTGDERCSSTSYAVNLVKHMFTYPAVNQKHIGSCISSSLVSRTETYYDGSTSLTAAPTRGNPTRQRTKVNSTAYVETNTAYDTLGRPIRVTDPNGAATTTAYEVTSGGFETDIPIRTRVTNALGHQVVTDYQPEFNKPTRIQDENNNITTYGYDEFGRLEMVWLPTEPVAYLEPSYRFSYDIPNRAVRSRRLTSESRCCSGVVFEDAWLIYDGFWRERQAQGLSPTPGKVLVSETTYDDRGMVRDELVEQALTGNPGAYLDGGASWLNRTRRSYDELGREVQSQWLRGTTVARTTTTAYGVDTVTVTGPDGRVARQRVDGLGRTVATEERDGATWASSILGYDLADRLTSVTDPEGNRITYGYDLAGRRTGQQDPNRGNVLYSYDNAGNLTGVGDSLGNLVVTSYDALSRPVARRNGSASGPLLASWTYDTAPGGKGKPARSTTVTPSGNWISEVVGYDIKGRPTATATTVPAGLPGLSGTYTVAQTYDRADRVRSVAYPAIGGLPAETVSTEYDNLGLPYRMTGLENYVWTRNYDDRGRAVSTGFGPQPNGTTWLATHVEYDADQRLSRSLTYLSQYSSLALEHQLTFDLTGNLTEELTRQNGQAWRECFGYDARSRLTSARTVAVTDTCAAGQPGTGDQPYAHSYQYSPGGKLTARIQSGVSTTYTYPAAGTAQAMAPTRIGNDTYQWNAVGNLVSRTVAGATETFAWDVQGQLRSVTGSTGTTGFEYDASGQRVLRRAPNGRVTVYVAGHEVSANADGSGVTAVRPYTFEGALVAIRKPSGVDYLVSDAAGSVEMAIPSGGQPNATRSYLPYGRSRFSTGTMATERGFLGQIEDSSTKLSYLNARYYDTAAGVFISPDKIYNTANLKSLNPYSYSTNNPTTFSDPSGNYSAYTYGLERANMILRDQNSALVAHIGLLNSHIAELQDVIQQQRRAINEMLTYIDALEAEIARQATIIKQLQARVAYLERVVVAQQREISRLRTVVARQAAVIRYQAGVIRYQAGVIQYQAGVIGYYKGVTDQLGGRLWRGTQQYASIMGSIHAGRGIPAGAFGSDRISNLTTTVREKNSKIAYQQDWINGLIADHQTTWGDAAFTAVGTIPGVGTAIGALQLGHQLYELGATDWIGDRASDAGDALSDAGDWLSDQAGDLFELRPPRFGF